MLWGSFSRNVLRETVSLNIMFLAMRNSINNETPFERAALGSLEQLLPPSWRLEMQKSDTGSLTTVSLVGPNGERATYAVELERAGQSIAMVSTRLRDLQRRTELPALYLSTYVGPTLRSTLEQEGVSYSDTSGWVRVVSDSPLILLTGQGARKAPHDPRVADITRFNGRAAGRLIRALLERQFPLGVRELAIVARTSPGSVSKLLPTLAREGIIERDESGRVATVRRRELVTRWVQDYSFRKTNQPTKFFLAPRGLDWVLQQIAGTSRPVTLTASAAARQMTPEATTAVVPLTLLALYTDDPELLADELGLVSVDQPSANVVIARPQDIGVLDADLAPVGLVLADMLSLPGRGIAEPEQLMDELARTDPLWRAT